VLPEPLFEAMNELKALGNDAAHIEAKAYDNIGADERRIQSSWPRKSLRLFTSSRG
jgi:hypothetical protein